MKQKILIPDGVYTLKNDYVPLMTPLMTNMYVSRGYIITPKDETLTKKIFDSEDKEIILNLNLKKDPRRNKATKQGNPLLLSFTNLLKDQTIKSDFAINMPAVCDTTLDLIFNQFLLPLDKNKENRNINLIFTGSLGTLRIDRSNPFKKITCIGNNTSELFKTGSDNRWSSWSKKSKVNIIDNTLEELDLLVDKNVSKDQQQSLHLNTLQSYSLKKIKIEGQYLDINSRLNHFKLPNLQEFDMSKIQKMDFLYNTFLTCIKNYDEVAQFINTNCKIKLDPNMKIKLGYGYDGNKNQDNPIALKELWNIKNTEPFEIKLKDLISIMKKEKKATGIIQTQTKQTNIIR